MKPFQPSVTFHIDTCHLICATNQMTGFYIKCNNGLKWVNVLNLLKVKKKNTGTNSVYIVVFAVAFLFFMLNNTFSKLL